jgi:hypothetical protein
LDIEYQDRSPMIASDKTAQNSSRQIKRTRILRIDLVRYRAPRQVSYDTEHQDRYHQIQSTRTGFFRYRALGQVSSDTEHQDGSHQI